MEAHRTLDGVEKDVEDFNKRGRLKKFIENIKKDDTLVSSLRSKIDDTVRMLNVSTPRKLS
jgi:hypothetical protein